MSRRFALAFAISIVASSLGTPAHSSTTSGYIVIFRERVEVLARTADLERTHGFQSDYVYEHALHGFAAQLSDVQLARVRADPNVAYVAIDRPVKAIGLVPLLPGDTAPPGVWRIGAATTTSASPASGVSVAVIDTGVDLNHSDLNVVSGKNCTTAAPLSLFVFGAIRPTYRSPLKAHRLDDASDVLDVRSFAASHPAHLLGLKCARSP